MAMDGVADCVHIARGVVLGVHFVEVPHTDLLDFVFDVLVPNQFPHTCENLLLCRFKLGVCGVGNREMTQSLNGRMKCAMPSTP